MNPWIWVPVAAMVVLIAAWRLRKATRTVNRILREELDNPDQKQASRAHQGALFVSFVGTVLLANWVTTRFGLVPAGFGLMVVSGTYAAGLALGLRDALHEASGVRWVLAAITVGAGLSFVVADARIALASGMAFLLSELADLAVYAPLRKRRWRTAVLASNAVGAVVDTLLFLSLAGFPLTQQAIGGQLLVKAIWVTGSFLLVVEVVRRALPRQRLQPEGA